MKRLLVYLLISSLLIIGHASAEGPAPDGQSDTLDIIFAPAVALIKKYHRFSFGVSDESPMGKLEKLKGKFMGAGLREEASIDARRFLPIEGEAVYLAGGQNDTVVMVADSGGNIQALVAGYPYSTGEDMKSLLRKYWNAVGAEKARAAKIRHIKALDDRISGWRIKGRVFRSGAVTGNWGYKPKGGSIGGGMPNYEKVRLCLNEHARSMHMITR
jgi:hypothetical protein